MLSNVISSSESSAIQQFVQQYPIHVVQVEFRDYFFKEKASYIRLHGEALYVNNGET